MTNETDITPAGAGIAGTDILEIAAKLMMMSQGGKVKVGEIYAAVEDAMGTAVRGAVLSTRGRNTIRGFLSREGKAMGIRSKGGCWA